MCKLIHERARLHARHKSHLCHMRSTILTRSRALAIPTSGSISDIMQSVPVSIPLLKQMMGISWWRLSMGTKVSEVEKGGLWLKFFADRFASEAAVVPREVATPREVGRRRRPCAGNLLRHGAPVDRAS